MKTQRELINQKDWDILLILDACRYDYFKDNCKYEDLDKLGKLQKVSSPASWTLGWMIETFKDGADFKDTIFISANPDVSSRGKEEKILDWQKRRQYGNIDFQAKDYFDLIIDVWDFGYDKEIDGVHPSTMINTLNKSLENNPKSKFICKFNQIHDPYLYFINKGHKVAGSNNFIDRNLTDRKGINFKRFLNIIFSDETIWRTRQLLRIMPKSGMAALWMKYGKQEIVKAYQEDLRLMLSIFSQFINEHPEKKIVITADHGELLGEYKRYGHNTDKRYPELVEIPWIEFPRICDVNE